MDMDVTKNPAKDRKGGGLFLFNPSHSSREVSGTESPLLFIY